MLNLIIGRENVSLDKVCMNSKLYFTRWKKQNGLTILLLSV